jgi:Mrp family chromosome partitioning ATPase
MNNLSGEWRKAKLEDCFGAVLQIENDDLTEGAELIEIVSALTSEQATATDQSLDRLAPSGLNRLSDEGLVSTPTRAGLIRPVVEAEPDPAQLDPHLVTIHDLDSRATAHYANLAVSLMMAAEKRKCRRVLIASVQRGEGRTCVTLNLAGALARAGRRALVIDSDLTRPSTLRLLGIKARAGLAETLADRLAPEAAVIRVEPIGFHLLGTLAKIINPAELLTEPWLEELLQVFDRHYDFILFDSPALLESGDGLLLQRLTDSALLVVRPGWTSSSQLARAMALFNQDDFCGVVLNGVKS